MALASTIVWEIVGSGGNDFWGGGFDSSVNALSVDYSQQNFPQVAIDGVSISGTSTGANANLILLGYSVNSGDLGNVVNILQGTNITAGRYEISSISLALNQWTLDRTFATGAANISLGYMGGAVQTLEQTLKIGSNSNTFFLRNPAANCTGIFVSFGSAVNGTYIVGYNNTRFDGGYCKILAPISGIVSVGTRNMHFVNLDIEPSAVVPRGQLGSAAALYAASNVNSNVIVNCRVSSTNWPNNVAGITMSNGTLFGVEISGARVPGLVITAASSANYCNIHHNFMGISGATGASVNINDCFIHDNTSDGILTVSSLLSSSIITDSTIYGNGGNGINNTTDSCLFAFDNVIANNGRFGYNSTVSIPPLRMNDNNIYFANTQGNRNNLDRTNNAHYLNTYDAYLNTTPFVDSSRGLFGLNYIAPSGGILSHMRTGNQPPNVPNTTAYIDAGVFKSKYITRGVGFDGGFSN
jgi:hypothetical protein